MDNAESKLTKAAQEAMRVVSDAAATAAHTVATAAAEAIRVTQAQDGNDHDLIVQLGVKMEDLRCDVKEIKDGTASRIDRLEKEKLNTADSYAAIYREGVEARLKDHEMRIRVNTERLVRIMTWGSVGVILIGIIEFVLNIYIKSV